MLTEVGLECRHHRFKQRCLVTVTKFRVSVGLDCRHHRFKQRCLVTVTKFRVSVGLDCRHHRFKQPCLVTVTKFRIPTYSFFNFIYLRSKKNVLLFLHNCMHLLLYIIEWSCRHSINSPHQNFLRLSK